MGLSEADTLKTVPSLRPREIDSPKRLGHYTNLHHSSRDTRIKSSNSTVSIRPFEKKYMYISYSEKISVCSGA